MDSKEEAGCTLIRHVAGPFFCPCLHTLVQSCFIIVHKVSFEVSIQGLWLFNWKLVLDAAIFLWKSWSFFGFNFCDLGLICFYLCSIYKKYIFLNPECSDFPFLLYPCSWIVHVNWLLEFFIIFLCLRRLQLPKIQGKDLEQQCLWGQNRNLRG